MHVLIMGDFNYPQIQLNTWRAARNNQEEVINIFINTIRLIHVNKPTRAKGTNTPHTLDLFLTNEEGMLSELEYWSQLSKSDHAIVTYLGKTAHTQYSYSYDKGDYTALIQDLDIDWQEVLYYMRMIQQKTIKTMLLDWLDKNVPKSTTRRFSHHHKTHIGDPKILAKI